MLSSKAAALLKTPIRHPLTGEATVPTLRATAQMAAAMELQNVPLSWRRVISLYDSMGAKLTFLPESSWPRPPPGYELTHRDDNAKLEVHVRSKPSLSPLDAPSGPVPGVHLYFVVGRADAVAAWVLHEYSRYPPTSHGTSFYKAADAPGGVVVFKGIRGSHAVPKD